MKRCLLGASIILLACSTLCSASDAPRGHILPVTKASLQKFTWDGFYVGGNFGTGIGDAGGVTNAQSITGGLAGLVSSFPNDASSRPRGWVYGGQIGVNKQIGWAVLGLEAELDWSTIKANSAAASSTSVLANSASSTSAQNLKWLSLVQGRLGIASGHWMPFVTGGVAFGKVSTDVATQATTVGITCLVGCGSASDSKTKTGWTVGGGIEAALDRNWSFKAQYNYVDLGSVSGSYAGTGTTLGPGTTQSAFAYNSEYRFHIVKMGVNYRF